MEMIFKIKALVGGEGSIVFCGSFRWKIEYENNKHANIADIDILTIAMDFIEFSSFVGLVNYL